MQDITDILGGEDTSAYIASFSYTPLLYEQGEIARRAEEARRRIR